MDNKQCKDFDGYVKQILNIIIVVAVIIQLITGWKGIKVQPDISCQFEAKNRNFITLQKRYHIAICTIKTSLTPTITRRNEKSQHITPIKRVHGELSEIDCTSKSISRQTISEPKDICLTKFCFIGFAGSSFFFELIEWSSPIYCYENATFDNWNFIKIDRFSKKPNSKEKKKPNTHSWRVT